MEKASPGLRIQRLLFGGFFTALGIWLSARVMLQLEEAHAAWPDWLSLLFPALPLALGILALAAAVHNRPVAPRPFLRHRSGTARVFGSATAGVFLLSAVLQHLFRQKTLGGVVEELVAAAVLVGLSASLFGAINADLRDQEQQSGK
ncbi:MAG TPA: hypothetical protein VLL04_07485 [Rhizomicrobium sp.]|nr:hypothetical protein [Rhizomicrobium sp.]